MVQSNIDYYRKKAGITVQQLADRAGISRGYLNELKRGDKRMNVDIMNKLSKPLGIKAHMLMSGAVDRIPIIGSVGAGGEVYPFDDMPLLPRAIVPGEEEYINCEWIDAPPGVYPEGIVALRVKGNSMMPFMPEGTIVYYAERFESGAPDHCLSTLCVVQMRDGRTLLKMVRKGHSHGKFDLQSYNMETITDVDLAWCAPVVFIKPFLRG